MKTSLKFLLVLILLGDIYSTSSSTTTSKLLNSKNYKLKYIIRGAYYNYSTSTVNSKSLALVLFDNSAASVFPGALMKGLGVETDFQKKQKKDLTIEPASPVHH